MPRKLDDSLANLQRALTKLEEALTIPKDRPLVVEGTIHRFEILIELFWKTLKRALEYEGLHPKTPRDSVKEAFRVGWLDGEAVWLDMLDSRNTTSHQYLAEELAEDNYDDIRSVMPVLRGTFDALKARYPAGFTS